MLEEHAERSKLWKELAAFVALAYAITWSVLGLYIVDSEWATRTFGPMKLGSAAFLAAVSAPSLSALVLAYLHGRWTGLRALLARLFRFRADWRWIFIALFSYAGMWLVVAAGDAVLRGELASMDLRPWTHALPAVLLAGHLFKDPGALGEELGWRGYALPRLLALTSARSAALLLGLVWAVWHLPAFFLAGLSQSAFAFGPYVLTVVAFSVMMTMVFVHTGGSVLWAGVVMHMMFNAVPKAGIEPVATVTVAAGAVLLAVMGPDLRGRRWRSRKEGNPDA